MVIQLSIRLPDKLHTKVKILGVYEEQTINEMVVEALQNKVDAWEKSNGTIPTPNIPD